MSIGSFTIFDKFTGQPLRTGRADLTFVPYEPSTEGFLPDVLVDLSVDWVDPETLTVIAPPVTAPDLGAIRAAAIAAINRRAGEVRSAYITVIPGQQMLYLRKEQVARDFLAATDPDPADYPLLAAEIGITASTGYELAQIWLNLGAQWEATAATMETARLGAINAVESASSEAEVIAARDGFMMAVI